MGGGGRVAPLGLRGALNRRLTNLRQAAVMPAFEPVTPQQFFTEFFGSRAAVRGEVVRRKVHDVERFIGRAAFLAEAARRGFPVVENAGQFVVFCNREPIRRLV